MTHTPTQSEPETLWSTSVGLFGPGPESAGRPKLAEIADRLSQPMLEFSRVEHGLDYDPPYSGLSRWSAGELDRHGQWVYKPGKFDRRRWLESLAGVPERYDHTEFSVGSWGVGYKSGFVGAEETSLKAGGFQLPAQVVADKAAWLYDELLAAATQPGVQTGFVHVDASNDPYRSVAEEARLLSRDHARHVPGYYWTLLLSASHLELLGGVDHFTAVAPCEDIVEVDQAGSPVWVCRLTTDPLALTQARVCEWREVLDPVLSPIFLTPDDLERSRWWCEPNPIVADRVRSLLSSPEAGEEAVPVIWSPHPNDPESVTVWIHPGPAFDRERDTQRIEALLFVWELRGRHGSLASFDPETRAPIEGLPRVIAVSRLRWDSDNDYNEALSFTVRFTAGDPTVLLERLGYVVPAWTFERAPNDFTGNGTWTATIDIDHITIA